MSFLWKLQSLQTHKELEIILFHRYSIPNELEYIRHYIHLVDKITVMTVDPGYAGQAFIPEMLIKISELKTLKAQHDYHYLIEIDGACNQTTFKDLLRMGSEVLIVGSSGLFSLDSDLEIAWDKMSQHIRAAM